MTTHTNCVCLDHMLDIATRSGNGDVRFWAQKMTLNLVRIVNFNEDRVPYEGVP